MTGVIKRFAKRERASDKPSALGCVSVADYDAIQLQDAAYSPQMRGLGLMFVFVTAVLMSWLVLLVPKAVEFEFRKLAVRASSVERFG